mgnify:CR=1 FL=1
MRNYVVEILDTKNKIHIHSRGRLGIINGCENFRKFLEKVVDKYVKACYNKSIDKHSL